MISCYWMSILFSFISKYSGHNFAEIVQNSLLSSAIQNYGEQYSSTGGFETDAFFRSLGDFFSIFMLSLLIGASMGCFTALISFSNDFLFFSLADPFATFPSLICLLNQIHSSPGLPTPGISSLCFDVLQHIPDSRSHRVDGSCGCSLLWNLSSSLYLQQFVWRFENEDKANLWVT